MKTLIVLLVLSVSILAQNNPKFDEYFLDETLRIDYFHIGDAKTEMITIEKFFRYGIWAGSLTHLVDNLNNGKYYYKIYDAASNKLIYSKGFDTFFGEYASGDDGVNGIMKSFHESAIIPFPKNKIVFSIEKRNDVNELVEFFRTEIDPASIYIIKDKIVDETVEILKPVYNGDPHTKVDIVILAEGYTKSEKEKFEKDLNKFVGYFFEQEPYKSQKSNFNIMVFSNHQKKAEQIYQAQIFLLTLFSTQRFGLLDQKDI